MAYHYETTIFRKALRRKRFVGIGANRVNLPALEGYLHEYKPYDPDSGLLHWLHVVISNAKAFILGTYHGLPKKYLQSYLDEFSFRFCRRDFGPALPERLTLAVSLSRMAD